MTTHEICCPLSTCGATTAVQVARHPNRDALRRFNTAQGPVGIRVRIEPGADYICSNGHRFAGPLTPAAE